LLICALRDALVRCVNLCDTAPRLRQGLQQIFGMAYNLCFLENSFVPIYDADGGLFNRNIQSGLMLHAALPP
jgi:hypothetical protein